MKQYLHHFVDGRRCTTTGAEGVEVVDPSTEEPSGSVRLCSSADLNAALGSARACADSWAATNVLQRQAALQRLRSALSERQEALMHAMAIDIGCPVWLSQAVHVPMALKGLDNAIEFVSQVQWSEVVGNAVVERVPYGVVAAITPWNAPLHQMVAKVAAAMAAGCTTVLKPSEMAPACADLFIDALEAAQLPPGVVNVVWGDARIAGEMLADPRVDKVSFTGSTRTGKLILARCAERVLPATVELGGKSAAVVLDDADLDAALPMVMRSCMANSGQTCVAQSRLIVPAHRMRDIEARLIDLAQAWPPDNPMNKETRLGPLASRGQFIQVQKQVFTALEQGARLACGGADRALPIGYFLAPTVLTGVDAAMQMATTEVFGPVLSVLAAKDDDDAIRLANATPYGLSGAVWSSDPDRAARAARRLRTGQVVLNGAAQNLATPFGGWGESGMGRENGRFGIEAFLQYRALHGLADSV